MTPETERAAAAAIRELTPELVDLQVRLQAIAEALREPGRITDAYIAGTSAAFHVFSALKVADALAGRLDPPPAPAAPPAPPEAQ
jgi:hypothetical protein